MVSCASLTCSELNFCLSRVRQLHLRCTCRAKLLIARDPLDLASFQWPERIEVQSLARYSAGLRELSTAQLYSACVTFRIPAAREEELVGNL